jgi:hypothetical protein
MFDSIYNKMFGGSVLQAQSGFETPGFNPDADGDGIPDVMDIDGGEGTGVPSYGTVDRPNLEDMYNDINFTPEANVNNPISGTIDRLSDNPYVRAGASILGAASDFAGLYNRIADQKTYLEAEDQKEERSGADYKYATKMSGPRSRGTYDALSGQLGSEADRVAGYYMNFAGSPYSYSGVAKKGGEFKPHMMFDPKTEEGYKANKLEDHLRMEKLGYTHEAPKAQDGGSHPYLQNYVDLFRNSGNIANQRDVAAIMSSMNVTPSDTLFVGSSGDYSMAKTMADFELANYLAKQINPEAYNAGQRVPVTYKDRLNFNVEEKEVYNDEGEYTSIKKSKKKAQDGGENLTSSSELPNFPEWRINSETSQLPEFPQWRVQNKAADLPEFPQWYINDEAKLYNKALKEMEAFIGSQTKIPGAKKGGEVVELSQDMIAQLIAAGADIEIL